MKVYQEITVIKTPDISPYFIWSKLYTQLHLALVEQQNKDKTVDIGVSFPGYKCFEKNGKTITILGDKLRVFANSEKQFEQLNLQQWLARLTDYLHIKSIQSVPENASQHLLVSRYQPVKNVERETRRFAKRKGIRFEDAKKQQNQRFAEKNNLSLKQAEAHYQNPVLKELPFIKMKSLSEGQEYALQIDQKEAEQEVKGSFSTYGLSSITTVPHW
jgi:CRISPR-associated endonuclease Csy4